MLAEAQSCQMSSMPLRLTTSLTSDRHIRCYTMYPPVCNASGLYEEKTGTKAEQCVISFRTLFMFVIVHITFALNEVENCVLLLDIFWDYGSIYS